MVFQEEKVGFLVSTDPALLQIDFIHRTLNQTYWASQRTRAVVEASIRHSVCFGVYEVATKRQVGFARIVTDHATFCWVCDVVVDAGFRQRGLGKRLMAAVAAHPSMQESVALLGTRDAHGLYEQFGFVRWEAMKRSNLAPPSS